MSRQSAELLASKGAYVDSGSWIEEFSGDHGKLWMKVTRKTGSIIVATLATSEDWPQTTGTILPPDTPNLSVSEFTYRMSRQTGTKVLYGGRE